MGAGAIGFGTGFLNQLTKNVEQGDENSRLRAILQGDILGAGGDPQDLGVNQGQQGGFQRFLSAIGAMKPQGPSIESLILQRQQKLGAERRQAKQRARFKEDIEAIRSGINLDPSEEASLLSEAPDAFSRMYMASEIKKAKGLKELEGKVEQRIRELQAEGKPLTRMQGMALQFKLNKLGSKMKVGDFVGKETSPFSKINPRDFTRESLGQFQETITPQNPLGDVTKLKRITPPDDVGELASALNAAVRSLNVVDVGSDSERQAKQTIKAIIKKLARSQVSPKDLQIPNVPEPEVGESQEGYLTRAWNWLLEQLRFGRNEQLAEEELVPNPFTPQTPQPEATITPNQPRRRSLEEIFGAR